MRKEAKDLWVAALKSGEFKQIKGKLHDGKGYCALGVLAALALNEGVCTFGPGNTFDGRTETISYNIRKWAEIDFNDDNEELKLSKSAGKITFVHNGKRTSVADLNDSGLSFKDIAEIIESVWREL